MGKKTDYWTHPQNRRAACLAMAIRHADAACYNYDAEDVIAHAAMFGDYIMTGEAPSMDDDTDTGDGTSEPVIGANAGLGTLDNEPLLDTPVAKGAAGEAKPTADDQGDTDAGAVSETESEKRVIEQMLAHVAKIGLRLEGQKIADDGVDFDWQGRLPADPLLVMIATNTAEDISSKLGKLFKAGHVCAVHYDEKGFPCVSWSPVSAAA
ncbi:hypothetical protein [Komagataeibacter oboediens]|uniref:hypothetical protein n=1 Tax=Komagataeibacter oboediens TaxID=65958 RepID=UPI001906D856|nr:hypothetical protein [Komagataeibacter oboediens]GCE80347.1 hypothetical protein MSKU3_1822 [Komagataeibacter oboediens]